MFLSLIKLKTVIRKIKSMTIRQLINILIRKFEIFAISLFGRARDARFMTYRMSDLYVDKLHCRLRLKDSLVTDVLEKKNLYAVCSKYLDHQFDLLGSGWVKVLYGMQCAGLEGHIFKSCVATGIEDELRSNVNIQEIQRIRSLLDPAYKSIDWHIDFKSGYRWNPDSWYFDIKYGDKAGVDIKVPWELARMQHLPQLARAYATESVSRPDDTRLNLYVFEFRNQSLDFISANPPRFGVNWSCTMDVAIRIANLLLAYDIFRSAGVVFDAEFDAIFSRSVREHGYHIVENLEWFKDFRGNHYLANLVGLIFVASYLPEDQRTNSWLQFAVQELLIEIQHQFNDEGSNFEGSTAYHGLSSQLVAFAIAMVAGLPPERTEALVRTPAVDLGKTSRAARSGLELHQLPGNGDVTTLIPKECWRKLYLMAEFNQAITNPAGRIVQVGDNDSGRLFKLAPQITILGNSGARLRHPILAQSLNTQNDELLPFEDLLNYENISQEIFSIVRHTSSGTSARSQSVVVKQSNIVFGLSGRRVSILCSAKKGISHIGPKVNDLSIPTTANRQKFCRPALDLLASMTLECYPEFGIYVWRSKNMFMTVRCGPVGQHGLGGHAHNDQLSLELWLGDEQVIADPGTYLYTPLPDKRNMYRSVKAHNAPQFNDLSEPGRLDLGVFSLPDKGKAKALEVTKTLFVGSHVGYGDPVYRAIEIGADNIAISDWCRDRPNSALIIPPPLPYSRGYGWLNHE